MPRAIWTNGLSWDSPHQLGGHHYARLLVERGWDVAFVANPVSPFHLGKRSTRRGNCERIKLWKAGWQRDLDGRLIYYTPMTLWPHASTSPFSGRGSLDNWHRWTVPSLRRKLEAEGFIEPDLMAMDSVLPASWISMARPRKTVFRVADDIAGFSGTTDAMIQRERELVSEVDCVVYTAKPLEDRLRQCHPQQMTYLPNGVDCDHFTRPAEAPIEYQNIPAPRAVYVGAIADWFDVELVESTARRLPDVSFVIIGRADANVSRLEGIDNVYLLGRKPYEQVPSFMQHAQVGLIPFRVSPLVHAVNPIKLYEYFAAGIPVVSVAWDELQNIASPARLTADADSFADAVQRSIDETTNGDAFRAFARQSDWRCRFDRLLEAVGLADA